MTAPVFFEPGQKPEQAKLGQEGHQRYRNHDAVEIFRQV
jgi:hypothetical protein